MRPLPFALAAVSAALAIPLLASNLTSAAQVNLVPNGDFSQGLAGWDDWFPNQTELTVTAAGTLNVQAKQPSSTAHFDSVSRCIAIPSDQQPYEVEGDVYVPLGQARKGQAYIRVQSWPTANCIAPTTTEPYHEYWFAPAGNLQHLSATFTPAAGTKAFRISLAAVSPAAGAGEDATVAFRAELDNIGILGDDGVADEPQDPPADDPTVTPTADKPGDPPADDPGDPPGDDQTVTPAPVDDPTATPTPGNPGGGGKPPVVLPEVPQGPFDVEVPGPLGHGPTVTPTPVATSTPEPLKPDEPSQPGKSDAPQHEPQAAEEPLATTDEPASQATPLPPSTGTGVQSGRDQPPVLAGLLLGLAGLFSSAGVLMRRRS
jgi:hypothetical protein